MKFETLHLTAGQRVPQSNISVMFANDMDPSKGFALEDPAKGGEEGRTHNVLETIPSDEKYSSLWYHQLGQLKGFAQVKDWKSAVVNFKSPLPVSVNCPVVE